MVEAARGPRRAGRWLAVAAVAVLAYWQAAQVGFLSDDHLFLVFAQYRDTDLALFRLNASALFYRPLGSLAWQIQHSLWAYSAVGYHFVSVGLHAANSLLVTALARQFWPRRPGLALSAGLLFAVLPFSIEAVVWLSSMFDLLVTATYLLTLLVLIKAWQGRVLWPYALAVGLYQLCLWSKEAAFSLPVMVVVVAALLPRRPRARVVAASVAPLLVLLALNFAQRWAVWGDLGGYNNTVYGDWRQLLVNLGSIAVKLLAPYNLRQFGPVRLWATLLGMTAVGLLGLWAARRQWRTLLFSVAWLALTIAVFINISGVGADLQNTRYLYLPAAGYVIGLVEVLYGAARRLAGRWPWLGRAAVAALAGYYFVLVQVQLQPWIMATRVTDSIAAEVHTLTAGARPASSLQVVNLPDNYQGAFVYRNGIEAVQLYRYGGLFNWERVEAGRPATFPNVRWPADLYEITLPDLRDAPAYPAVAARAIGLSTPGAQTLPPDYWMSKLHPEARALADAAMSAHQPTEAARWVFADCQSQALAAWSAAAAGCAPGHGLALGTAALTSPAVSLSRAAWLKVVVHLDIPAEAGTGGELTLSWLPAGETGQQALPLPAGPFAGALHFFIPPGGPDLEQLRLSVAGAAAPVLVKEVAVFGLE